MHEAQKNNKKKHKINDEWTKKNKNIEIALKWISNERLIVLNVIFNKDECAIKIVPPKKHYKNAFLEKISSHGGTRINTYSFVINNVKIMWEKKIQLSR